MNNCAIFNGKVILDDNTIHLADEISIKHNQTHVSINNRIFVLDNNTKEFLAKIAAIEKPIQKETISIQNPYINSLQFQRSTLRQITYQQIASRLRALEHSFTEIKVFIATWNVAGQPPCNLDLLLGEERLDLYVIGLQEMDLSSSAFVLDSSIGGEWCEKIKACLKGYILISAVQLVGIFLVVLSKEQCTEVLTTTSAQGFVGMGNKGAALIRIRYKDSYLCFINSHLASDIDKTERRNKDYERICETVFKFNSTDQYYLENPWVPTQFDRRGEENPFTPMKGLSIFDCDHIFWFGDLNYRLDLNYDECIELIKKKDWLSLLSHDQLLNQRLLQKTFRGFMEQTITFAPTYKYDLGTNTFDTSEKKRVPAYCDRILYFNNPFYIENQEYLKPLSYGSSPMVLSDHKPVYSRFSLWVRTVDRQKIAEMRQLVETELKSKLEEARPKVWVHTTEIDLGKVSFGRKFAKRIIVENTGLTIATIFINCNTPWITISQNKVGINPDGFAIIALSIEIKAALVPQFNRGAPLESRVELKIEDNDAAVEVKVHGIWELSVFGEDISTHCRLLKPIRNYSLDEFKNLVSTEINLTGLPKFDLELGSPPTAHNANLSIPKEIHRLLNFVYKYGLVINNLMAVEPDPDLVEYFAECLDSGNMFDIGLLLEAETTEFSENWSVATIEEVLKLENYSSPAPLKLAKGIEKAVASALRLLLLLLKSSSSPLIPVSVQESWLIPDKKPDGAGIGKLEYNTLQFIVAFCKQFISSYHGDPPIKPLDFARLLVPAIMWNSSRSGWGISNWFSGTDGKDREIKKMRILAEMMS